MGKRFLMIGAHPDDADIRFGGPAVKLVKAGHTVKFVSMCNGDCGHYSMSGKALADRRYAETQASKAISGIFEYQVMSDIHDCEITADVATRKRVIRIIREFAPDVVLSHRLCDYHADHRATAQLVQDAAYLTQVPAYCPESLIPEVNPVFGCVWDAFTDPRPIRPDAAVDIDDVLEQKCRMLDCHVSQVYEFLHWENTKTVLDPAKMSWEEKKAHLIQGWCERFKKAADENRQALIEQFGEEKGSSIRFAEFFELSPYGRKISVEEFRNLMNGL